MEHLQDNDENQHSFRAGHSCQTQLISLIEDLLCAMDSRYQTDITLLYFSKAFDKVPHRHLLTKLENYGNRGHLYTWIETWLTQRTQWVVIDGESSSSALVTSGVPQGTVWAPSCF